ncbi:MAG: DUF2141 domain-containing protein [Magnetospirillum sp.]|nr:DUF2141 domain-containing protein [Magnetospirillum sp.]
MRRLLLAAVCLLAVAPAARAADLSVTVTNVKPDSGDIRIVVISDPDHMSRQDDSRNLRARDAKDGSITTRFLGLAPGEYGLIAIHDTHANHAVEQVFTGTISGRESNSGEMRVNVAEPASAVTLALP